MIAIVAGVITVVAITLALASGYLGLTWLWLRPAAELLLLAELVGLIVLERHQLFEPVHEKVGAMRSRVDEIYALVLESARSSGQVVVCSSAPEVFSTGVRVLREALERDQTAPQVLRMARLSGRLRAFDDPDLLGEFRAYGDALSAFSVIPGSPPEARTRRWAVREIFTLATRENFEIYLEQVIRPQGMPRPSNVEMKIQVIPTTQAVLAPLVITDHDVVITFDDAGASFRWGLWFQGARYRALVERWFDDLWANIPDGFLIYSRGAFDESAIGRVREALGTPEATHDRASVRVNES